MKILEVITDTNIGGAGILLATRCEYMDRSKYEVIVALPQRSRLRERFVRMGISVVEINGCYDRSFEIQSIPKWIAILKNIRPEIVNCHGCLSCRIAARLCHVPILFDTRHCAFPPKGWQTVFPGKNTPPHRKRATRGRPLRYTAAAPAGTARRCTPESDRCCGCHCAGGSPDNCTESRFPPRRVPAARSRGTGRSHRGGAAR